MRLVDTVALAVFLASSSTDAFGPARPLQATSAFAPSVVVTNSDISSNSERNGIMTMRIGKQDMGRKQRLNDILKKKTPTKETVQNVLLTSETSELIQKCNWRVRKTMIRKVQNEAQRYDLTVDPTFGVP
jgi:hypothetical protein